jgi:hypothetical protein
MPSVDPAFFRCFRAKFREEQLYYLMVPKALAATERPDSHAEKAGNQKKSRIAREGVWMLSVDPAFSGVSGRFRVKRKSRIAREDVWILSVDPAFSGISGRFRVKRKNPDGETT